VPAGVLIAAGMTCTVTLSYPCSDDALIGAVEAAKAGLIAPLVVGPKEHGDMRVLKASTAPAAEAATIEQTVEVASVSSQTARRGLRELRSVHRA
jgi:hypothetical protein